MNPIRIFLLTPIGNFKGYCLPMIIWADDEAAARKHAFPSTLAGRPRANNHVINEDDSSVFASAANSSCKELAKNDYSLVDNFIEDGTVEQIIAKYHAVDYVLIKNEAEYIQ